MQMCLGQVRPSNPVACVRSAMGGLSRWRLARKGGWSSNDGNRVTNLLNNAGVYSHKWEDMSTHIG